MSINLKSNSDQSFSFDNSERSTSERNPLRSLVYLIFCVIVLATLTVFVVPVFSDDIEQQISSKDIKQIEILIQKYGKPAIIDNIKKHRGQMISIQYNGQISTFYGEWPNEQLITAKSIAVDINKIGQSLVEFADTMKQFYDETDSTTNQQKINLRQKKETS